MWTKYWHPRGQLGQNLLQTQTNRQIIFIKYRSANLLYFLIQVWTVLREKGSFDEDTTRFIASCVTTALEYLHERSIIYRDLKPENLLLCSDGYVKVSIHNSGAKSVNDFI
jgi:serine/threonine protein kinase